MNNTININIFNSDNSNIGYIKTENCQIMESSAYRIFKFEAMIKKTIKTNHAFSSCYYF